MSIQEIQEEIIEEFAMFEDWMQRYEYMIDLGKTLPLIAAEFKTDDNIIKGCQSKVWVHAHMEQNKLNFTADSDAIITKGIVGMVVRVFYNHAINIKIRFIFDKIGLKNIYHHTRSNGLGVND